MKLFALLGTLCLALVLVEAKPKQCRVVNKKREAQQAHAQNPFPPTSTSPLSPSGTASASASTYPSPTAFDYSKDKIRGVNLGGWLLLEPWITPSLFENTGNEQIVDEYTFNTLQDAATVRRILREHWETWIVEDDFRKIAEAGLNHVRLPFGYWSVPRPGNDPTPYNPDAWPYVMKAIDWARKYNLFVIMDIHGAPGSQNGYDNSGQRMNMPQWHTSAAYVNQTLDVVAWLAQTFGGPEYENLVTMIQLMNEPAGFYPEVLSVMRDYYQRSYWIVRPISNHLLVALHDGFQPLSIWSTRTNVPSPENTIMDTHIYQIFNDAQVTMSWDDKLKATCDQGNTLASYTAREDGFRTYVGEWTTSYTDCAKWLNGRGVGARLDGTRAGSSFLRTCEDITGTMDKFSESYKTWLRRYWDAQTIAFERGNGWVYWTWKTEIADEWSYSKGLEGGWIPQDPTNHIYNAC
ncbi:glycosyl hydrolase 5 (cellulase A) family, partial [Rhizoctonia solani]